MYKLERNESRRLAYLYRNGGLSTHQLAKVSGYSKDVLDTAARLDGWAVEHGWAKNKAVRIRMEDSFEFQCYAKQARRIAGYMFSQYAEVLSFNKFKFGLSVLDAFGAFPSSPIDLRFVCHPANLLPESADTSNFDLKARIRAFEAKHGKVQFPAYFLYDYKLAQPVLHKHELKVLGFDPGSKNFGCFAGRIVDGVLVPMESSMLQYPITEIKGQSLMHITSFMNEMRSFLDCYEPDVVVIERFMSRGLKGKTIELVSIMLGVLSSLVFSYRQKGSAISLNSVTAASWKNRVNQIVPLTQVYADLKPHKVPDHQVDAALMSLYSIGKTNPYEYLSDSAEYDSFIDSMVMASQKCK